MLIAGGLAGLSAATIVQGQTAPLTSNSYGTYGFDGITVALLGRARPFGVVLAGLLFGALHAGGTVMEAATGGPVRRRQGHRGPDRALRRRAPADPAAVPAAARRRHRPAGRRVEGMVG